MFRPTILAAALACAAPAMAQDFPTAEDLSAAHGTFRSAAPEPWYGGFGTREFIFADGRWHLIFTQALDPEMTLRTFQFRTGGPFEVGAASTTVPGAFDAIFYENWKHVTLLTEDPAIIAGMGMADCGLTYNIETDISVTGCAAWRPVAVCGEDHDLFAMDAAGVYFGVRPADNDMCAPDKRPTALLPVVARY
ncbi:hypothetical protein SAMN05444339_10516 [Loktanella atrilutea]|uniref:APCDD1 domain-containing protein n=1 Tax=Loktanella atrilutea TaxID=366533 RepID=A0A1M5AMI6_LOKAT|nr:hypothetical protein [Loktanella atrilutea]SHF31132.1 hypothetical protein SAMN05444339_10516 [Loktanella atrilutea]